MNTELNFFIKTVITVARLIKIVLLLNVTYIMGVGLYYTSNVQNVS